MVAMKLLLLLLAGALQLSAALQCQVNPTNYTFVTAEVQREPEPGCSNGSTNYTVCSTPSRLTDSELGPQHNPTDNSPYYIFQGSAQSAARYYILFTFNQTVDITNITLHYFVHNQVRLQPVVNAFRVGDNFELQNNQSVDSAGTVRLLFSLPQSPSRGLHSASRQGPILLVSKVVLDINAGILDSVTNFCLSEVEFFTRTSTLCPEPPTTSSTPATTEPPTTATGPTTDPPVTTESTTTATAYTTDTPTTTEPSTTVTDSTTTEPPSPAPAADVPTAAIAAGVAVGVLLLIILVIIAVITFLQCSKKQRKAQPVELTGYTEENEELQNTHYEPVPTRSPLTGETTSDELDSGPNTYASIGDVKEEKINLVTSTAKTVALVTDPNIGSKEERDNNTEKEGETKTGIFENPEEFYAVVDQSKKLSNKESNNTEKEEGEMKTGIFQNPEEFYAVVDKSEKLSNKESKESNEPRSAEDDEKTAQPVYAVVHKPAKSGEDGDGGDGGDGGEGGDQPVLPPHTAEMLYTAVIKKGTCAE